MLREIAFDTETFPLGFWYPRGSDEHKACFNPVPKMVCMTVYGDHTDEPQLYRGERAVQVWSDLVIDDQTKLIGHNIAFDHLVMARAQVDQTNARFDRGEIGELIHQYENPAGLPGGKFHDTKIRQQLIDVATRGTMNLRSLDQLANYHLDEHKHEGGDEWRDSYNELDPYPTELWPSEAVEYAKLDAELTYRVYQSQKKRKRSALGTTVAHEKGVVNEPFQCRADFALSLMSAWGLKVDPVQTKKANRRYEKRKDELQGELQQLGIVDSTGKKDMEEVRRRYAKAFKKAGLEPERTSTGKIATNKNARAELKRNTTLPESLKKYDEWSRVRRYLSTYFRPLLAAEGRSLCPGFGALVKSGRTSSSKPNLQNFPKRSKPNQTIDPKSVRRCFRPRPGWTYVCGDWSRAELRCLAQVNLNFDHQPVKMAQAARSGRDLHTELAADILSVDYDEAVARLDEGDGDVKRARNTAKVANFGYPGGMGPSALPNYAQSFGVELTVDRAEKLAEQWHSRWPEMDKYFAKVRAHKSTGTYPIKQHGPFGDDRPWRVRNAHGYTDACNSLFQGLAADGGKAALWLLVKECYADESSDLYGCRPNVYVHDEFLIEAPDDQAMAAARRLREVMIQGMEMFTPDVPADVDLEVGPRWGEGKEL